jgi:asparagine synthase (glutamine-hydrolysing)
MCGIAGLIESKGATPASDLEAMGRAMANALAHRGPDDNGVWVDAEQGLVLAHTRLAIIDLSPAGAQPMVSSCGGFVLSYNGEIYNAAELRTELESLGCEFRSHSDTEVIVEGCARWGVVATVKRLIGMFAFALWERRAKQLVLVRDRLGIKPLYWGRHGRRFMFGSELKALTALPGWHGEVDRNALAAYMRLSYVPSPQCIYKGIHKLQPGSVLVLKQGGEPVISQYWSLENTVTNGRSSPLDMSDSEACDELEALLGDAVKRRMVADVPLGAFLSGGVDSSATVALMQANASSPVRSFSIGFHESEYNEANHAKAVAQHLGTEHTELYVTPEETQNVIPRLPAIYDEPFADSSQIPTFLVSQMTRSHVTVALSGDGGDELFAGYNRYTQGARAAHIARKLPMPGRKALQHALTALSPTSWSKLFGLVPASIRPRMIGDKLHKLAIVLGENEMGYYRHLVSQWDGAWRLVKGAAEPKGLYQDASVMARFDDHVDWMQYIDTMTYLPDDILAKVDRASMAVALEARVPMLDHRVVEFTWRLPMAMKVRNGQGKWLLRQMLYRHVPKSLIERPKMGFGLPVSEWLRGPLKEWCEDLISPDALERAGYLDPAPIQQKWQEHLDGSRNWQYVLWNVLMFEAWRRENRL